MFSDYVRRVMVRDLNSVVAELEAYEDESDIWRLAAGVNNSAGTLALHLAGNIQHFVGAVLGGSGYTRDRDAEFSRRNVPRAEMVAGIGAAILAVKETLPDIVDAQLEMPFPEAIPIVPPDKDSLTVGQFLIHLTSHLNFHLGQLDYHRRALTGGGPIRGILGMPPLLAGD